jgi:hypothetical protein
MSNKIEENMNQNKNEWYTINSFIFMAIRMNLYVTFLLNLFLERYRQISALKSVIFFTKSILNRSMRVNRTFILDKTLYHVENYANTAVDPFTHAPLAQNFT